MNFKEWLLNEDSPASQFFYKLSLYPTDAFDGGEAFSEPKEVYALRQRWDIEEKEGRIFFNLDKKDYDNKKIFTLHSLTMPDATPGFWRHKKQNRRNLELKNVKLSYLGDSKNSDPVIITKTNPGLEIPLDKIFGDTFKKPKGIDGLFDKPFRNVKEDFTPFSDISQMDFSNKNLGVRSKYVGPDDTGEEQEDSKTFDPEIDFGFKKKRNKNQKYIDLLKKFKRFSR